MTTTPNMGLILPDVNVTPGPTWATMLNAEALIIDAHSHLPGSGVPIVSAAININADLPFNQNDATTLRTVRLNPWTTANPITPIIGGSDLCCIYSYNNELYYIDGVGNVVQITSNGYVDTTPSSAITINDDAFTLQYFGNTTRKAQFSVANVPNSTTYEVAIPAFTSGSSDTMVTAAATQTLTNKTLTTPTISSPALSGTTTGTFTLAGASISGSSNTITNVSLTSGVTGVLPIANGGTDNGSLPVTAGGVLYTDGTKFQNTGAGTSGQYLYSNGSSAPTWKSLVTPSVTIQGVTGGTQTGTLFTSSGTVTFAVGDTYTGAVSGHVFTVLVTETSAPSGTLLWVSGSGAMTAGENLTRTTGSGTSTISTASPNYPMATYTTPSSPSPIYLEIEMIGGGGGGAGGSNSASLGGTSGTYSTFGTNLLICGGGAGGTTSQASSPSAGGTGLLNSPAVGLVIQGSSGGGGINDNITGYASGVSGGSSPFGGAGAGAADNAGSSAIANTGSGGAGGGCGSGNAGGGGGGASGCYIKCIIPSPATSYYYIVGSGGAGGLGGSGGFNGGTGGTGILIVKAYYQ